MICWLPGAAGLRPGLARTAAKPLEKLCVSNFAAPLQRVAALLRQPQLVRAPVLQRKVPPLGVALAC